MSFPGRIAAQIGNVVLVTLLAGSIAAVLVRYSPGYGMDESDLNPRLSAATVRAMRARRASEEASLPRFYAGYLARAVTGDLGTSQAFQQPIATLLADRAPATFELVVGGSLLGWIIAFVFAALAVRFRHPLFDFGASAGNGMLLSVPPAVLALLFFHTGWPLTVAMGLIVAPRLYSTLRLLFDELSNSSRTIAARARGLTAWQLGLHYFALPAAGRLVALLGIAAVIAFGCAVPIEALCDSPGIGQLAWKAALARDLPLLSALTLTITVFVTCLNAVSDLFDPERRGA